MRICWKPVNDNSSSIDAVVSFARGDSLSKCADLVWDPKVKKIFRQLRRLPVTLARARAKDWCKAEGFSYRKF